MPSPQPGSGPRLKTRSSGFFVAEAVAQGERADAAPRPRGRVGAEAFAECRDGFAERGEQLRLPRREIFGRLLADQARERSWRGARSDTVPGDKLHHAFAGGVFVAVRRFGLADATIQRADEQGVNAGAE